MEPILVEGFPKNRDTLIAGQIAEFEGRLLAHVREASLGLDGQPVWQKKGVSMPLDALPALQEAVHRLKGIAAPNRLVARIPVGKQEIRIGTRLYNDVFLLDIRRFYQQEGQWLPGRGVSVRGDLIDELIDLVDRLADAARNLQQEPEG